MVSSSSLRSPVSRGPGLRAQFLKAYNEAKGKPRVALDNAARVVTAVVALARHVLVALDLLPERVLSAGEDDTHSVDCRAAKALLLVRVAFGDGGDFRSRGRIAREVFRVPATVISMRQRKVCDGKQEATVAW